MTNRAAATPLTPEAKEENNDLFRMTILPSANRVGILLLLLKTTLPRPAVATGAPVGRIFLSIAALDSTRNQRCSIESKVLR